MIDSLLHSLASWPPVVVYVLIAISCVVESIFPPSPSDVFVTMAAFLSHDGRYQPGTIFLTAWIGGVGGAILVYFLAARFASRFTGSRVGKLLLEADAMAFLLKQYGRYGGYGLFLTRLLPGFRSVVAPFVGLNRLPLWRLVVPVALACGTWYGALTWVGTRLGDEWEMVTRILDRIYSALGAVAAVVAVLLVIGFLWWRRRRTAE